MESALRKNLLKEATRDEVEAHAVVGGGLMVGAAALLTAVTAPWLAPLWILGAGASGVAATLALARRRLHDQSQVAALAERTVLTYHVPREIPPELAPYVSEAVRSAVSTITRIEQSRNQPVYSHLRDVVDTVGFLLDRITFISERIVATERLFEQIQSQIEVAPAARLSGDAGRDFNRNLHALQTSIDSARSQIVDATASLQQIGVQTLLIQSQDDALAEDTTGTLRRMATDQAEQLQIRISAMDEVAMTTRAATGKLLGR